VCAIDTLLSRSQTSTGIKLKPQVSISGMNASSSIQSASFFTLAQGLELDNLRIAYMQVG
jgi:hypothetical protein